MQREYPIALMLAVLLPCCMFAEDGAKRGKPQAINLVFGLDPGKGNYDGVVGKPTHTWNLVDVGETKLERLRNVKGKPTSVQLQLSPTDGEWGIEGQSGVYHAYLYHNCRCIDLQASLAGLAPGRYKIYVFAHGDAPDQNAEIELQVGKEVYGRKATLNDGSWGFRDKKFAAGVQFVSFDFTVEAKESVLITSRRAGSDYSMFNAIQVVPLKK